MKTTTVAVKATSADEENENDYIDSGDRDELRVVILAFINDEEEVERPTITHSGRTNNTIAINMRSVLTATPVQYSQPDSSGQNLESSGI